MKIGIPQWAIDTARKCKDQFIVGESNRININEYSITVYQPLPNASYTIVVKRGNKHIGYDVIAL